MKQSVQMIAGALVLMFGGSALAQTAPAAPPASAPAAGAAAAAAATAASKVPSKNQIDLALRLVMASGMQTNFLDIVTNTMQQLGGNLTRTRPEIQKDLMEVMLADEQDFLAYANQMIDKAAEVYALVLTEKELQDAVTFFESPSGKRYIQVQPAALEALGRQMQLWRGDIAVSMMERVRADMKKRNIDI